MSDGGSAEEHDRMKRSDLASPVLPGIFARATIDWWMVGTAVYQLGRNSSIHSKNFGATNPGPHTTLPPDTNDASSAASNPWIWNSGMTFKQRSSGVSAREAAMLRADAARLAWVSGTSFGLDVVPEVWSRSATSLGCGERAGPWLPPATFKAPFRDCAVNSNTGMPNLAATFRAADSRPASTTTAAGPRSAR